MTIFSFYTFQLSLYGHSIIDIIDRLPIIYSPIRLTYLIFALVLISLGYYCITAFRKHITLIQTLLFFINALLQIVAVYYWYNEMPMYALLALIMLLIGIFVFYITFSLNEQCIKRRIPIASWFSWTIFFTLITFNYNMVAYEWSGFNLSDGLWAVILLTIGAAIALHLRYHYFDRVSPFIFIIGYLGIIISNGFKELFVSTAALFLIGVLVVGLYFFKKKSIH